MRLFNRNKSNVIFFLIALFLTLFSIAGFVHAANVYYVFLAVLGLMVLFQSRLRIEIGLFWMIPFIVACILSLLINDPPVFFNAWNRLLVFIIILIIVSPLFVNKSVGKTRDIVLHYILVTCVALSVGSFFAYFLGINLFDRGEGYLDIEAGKFSGLMNHSIVLGHFSGLATAFVFSLLLSSKRKQPRFVLTLCLLFCFSACLFSASRNGIISCVVACLVAFLSHFRNHLSRGIIIGFLAIVVIVVTFPIWGNVTDFVVEKNEANIEQGGSLFFSREQKFNARIQEFKSNPIFGIGCNTVDPRLDVVNLRNGQVEPGSSWLAVASMTGLMGLIPFIMICLLAAREAWNNRDFAKSTLLSSLLFFYYVHMISEGYIFAPRSFLSFVFWLILGVIYQDKGK